jgi:hypothetical protein
VRFRRGFERIERGEQVAIWASSGVSFIRKTLACGTSFAREWRNPHINSLSSVDKLKSVSCWIEFGSISEPFQLRIVAILTSCQLHISISLTSVVATSQTSALSRHHFSSIPSLNQLPISPMSAAYQLHIISVSSTHILYISIFFPVFAFLYPFHILKWSLAFLLNVMNRLYPYRSHSAVSNV